VGRSGPLAGLNWPNAGRVYVGHFSQQSIQADRPDQVFVQSRVHGLADLRIFVGDNVVFGALHRDRPAALADMDRMLADAGRHGQRLVLSNYLTQASIEALAGHSFPSWAAAQQDLTAPGSASWTGLQDWFGVVVPRFARNTAVASWEVVNEPAYMLGVDAGAVGVNAEVGFLDHFQQLLHQLGARSVNAGGRPALDLSRLDDEQMRRYATHLDVLDDHLYPGTGPAGQPVGGATAGRDAVASTQAWFERVRALTGRPDLPGMVGELGSQDEPWFRAALDAGLSHGWTVLAWGYDAYDANRFTSTVRPEVLAELGRAGR